MKIIFRNIAIRTTYCRHFLLIFCEVNDWVSDKGYIWYITKVYVVVKKRRSYGCCRQPYPIKSNRDTLGYYIIIKIIRDNFFLRSMFRLFCRPRLSPKIGPSSVRRLFMSTTRGMHLYYRDINFRKSPIRRLLQIHFRPLSIR